MLRLHQIGDRIEIAGGQDVQHLLIVLEGLVRRQIVGKIGRLDDERLVGHDAVECRYQLVPLRLLRPERDRDRNDRNIGEEMPDVRQDGADAVVLLEQVRGFDQPSLTEQPGCVLLIGPDDPQGGLEIAQGGGERQPRFLEVVREQDDDPVVARALGNPKRMCDQVGRQQVVRNSYSGNLLPRYLELRGGVDRAQKRIGIGVKRAERRRSFLGAACCRRNDYEEDEEREPPQKDSGITLHPSLRRGPTP